MDLKRIMNKKRAFSLAEALLSILIVSIILIFAAPILIKAQNRPEIAYNGGSQGFYYKESDADGKCYETSIIDNKTTLTPSKNCQEYEFTIPDGVFRMDFTLVAGGGGGGGAAGGTVYERRYLSTELNGSNYLQLTNIYQDRIKSVKINLLTGQGGDGNEWNAAYLKSIFDTGVVPSEIQGSKGGKSGMAIASFELPESFYKNGYLPSSPQFLNLDSQKINFVYNLRNSKASAYRLSTMNGKFSDILSYDGIGLYARKTLSGRTYDSNIFVSDSTGAANIQCFNINYPSSGSSPTKLGSRADLAANSASGLYNVCGLTEDSYKLPQDGNYSYLPTKIGSNTVQITSGYTLPGGEGAKVPGTNVTWGQGGPGQPLIWACDNAKSTSNCKLTLSELYEGGKIYGIQQNPTSSEYATDSQGITKSGSSYGLILYHPSKWNKTGGDRYGDVSIQLDNPGGVGSGGAGGTAIKINDYPVMPGEKYTVVVGKGGSGGESGRPGLIQMNEYSSYPQEGLGGNGGTSTAIYDSNGQLIVMVIGGVGGNGGKINGEAITMIPDDAAGLSFSNYNTYKPLPDLPDAARNIPLIIYNQKSGANIFSGENNRVDKSLIEQLVEPKGDYTLASGINGTVVRPLYAYMKEDAASSPLFELNAGSNLLASSQTIARNNDDNKITTGGFSQYRKDTTNIAHDGKYGSTAISGFYNGFYFRNVINGSISYAGGLGGHSGLGGKAGCGGLFVGNQNVSLGGINTNAMLVNINGNNVIYNVASYYSNCSIQNADGQTAEFVPPTATPALGQTLGQAGSGGGGGGWSQKYGAGKGGDGQNGYAFFSWRTR